MSLYLRLEGDIYFFRIAVPADLRQILGKREIKRALHTGAKKTALPRARQLALDAKNLFAYCRSMSKRPILPISDFGIAKITLPNGCQLENITTDPNNPEDAKALQDFLMNISGGSVAQPSAPKAAYMLSQAIADFFDEKIISDWKKEKTIATRKTDYQVILEILGDGPVADLNKDRAREFKNILLKFPSNRAKKPQYRDKTIPEIVAMAPTDVMDVYTINKYLNHAAALGRWLVKEGRIENNPFSDFKIGNKSQAKDDRDAFKDEHLTAVFNGPSHTGNRPLRSSYFWLPVIARYSGLRLGEICQLHAEDIREVDGIYVFDITDTPPRSLKTAAARRIVPIHREILRLEFLEFVSLHTGQLFPELKPVKGNWSHDASKWFRRYLNRVKITDPKIKFHSFRHSFVTELLAVGVEEATVIRLVGHTFHDTTQARYAKGLPVAVLHAAVEKISPTATVHLGPYGRWRTK